MKISFRDVSFIDFTTPNIIEDVKYLDVFVKFLEGFSLSKMFTNEKNCRLCFLKVGCRLQPSGLCIYLELYNI